MAEIKIVDCIHMPVNKIQAIKALRNATNLGLKEAKDTVEGLPFTYHIPSWEDVDAVAQKLREQGFQVEYNSPISASTSDAAFKNLLIALINEDNLDEVVRFIQFKKRENAGRRLEPV